MLRCHSMAGNLADAEGGRLVVARLALVRQRWRLSRRAVAALLGCSVATVRAWETGRRRPSAMALEWLRFATERLEQADGRAWLRWRLSGI